MQCVAQATPFIGVGLTVLNRNTLKAKVDQVLHRGPHASELDSPEAAGEAPAAVDDRHSEEDEPLSV
jgi:hypothetical protein